MQLCDTFFTIVISKLSSIKVYGGSCERFSQTSTTKLLYTKKITYKYLLEGNISVSHVLVFVE